MQSVLIRIDPTKLESPDADLRYTLSELLAERSDGRLAEDGYDYDDSDRMILFLESEVLDHDLPLVLQVVQREPVLGNDLSRASQVAVGGPIEYRVVFPAAQIGESIVVSQ